MPFKIKYILLFSIIFALCFVDKGPQFLAGTFCSTHGNESVLFAQTAGTKETGSEKNKEQKSITAYYFHGNFRCTNCRKIEQYSREAIEEYFTEELKTKKLVFSIINTDQPENKHFIKDYQLYTRSLIIAEFKGGRQVQWKNLTGVWNYLGNREKFYNYVRSEIRAYLEAI